MKKTSESADLPEGATNKTYNIIRFKRKRRSREQRRRLLIRIMAIVGVVLTLGGLVLGILYDIL